MKICYHQILIKKRIKVMKTKTIITAIILLFSLTSFVQTKEETIVWVKEKLEQHGGSDSDYGSEICSTTYKDVKVTPCGISFTEKSTCGKEWAVNFNASKAKSWKFGSNYIKADAQIIQTTYSKGKKSSDAYLSIRNGESGIHERMIKALTHLSTFCEQKKEAF